MEPLHLTRRGFLAATTAALGQAQPSPKPRRPNLLICVADELRAESIGCYGHPLVKTPNMDRLAGEGTRFAQCHVQNTVCEPSRCSFLTGWPVHVRGHRSLFYGLHADEPNLFRYLKEANYDVFWFGKNDLFAPESFAGSVTHARQGSGATMFTRNAYPASDPRYYSFLWEKGTGRRDTSDYANVELAVEVLRGANDKPFCIFLPLNYPHPPYSAPEDFHDMYRAADIPPLRAADLRKAPRFHKALRAKTRLDEVKDGHLRQLHAVYLGMVSYADWVLGELLAAVDQAGHREDTVVVYTSDHGDYAGDYGLVEKWPNAMADVLTRIPLIVRAPGEPGGHVVHEITELYDVMATCLDLARVEARHTHFAHSLVPQLQGKPGDPARAAFCEGGYNRNEPQCFEPINGGKENPYYPKLVLQNEQPDTITRSSMVRTARHKLIYRPDDQSELYDLTKDPLELQNVFGERSYRSPQEELHHRLLTWYVTTSDVAPRQLDPRGLPGSL